MGVIIDEKFSFSKHVEAIIKKATFAVYSLNLSITSRKPEIYLKLYVTVIRPLLEYASAFWDPPFKKESVLIENVQRRVTKRVLGLSNLSYENRLRNLKLPSLWWRRKRGALILMYKIIKQVEINIPNTLFEINQNQTRGSGWRLKIDHVHLNMAKNSFRHRLKGLWNSLPREVTEASSVNNFKNKLDDHILFHTNLYYYFD